MSDNLEKATLGGGCFWCLEAVYQTVKGVHEVVSGYAGGTVDNPTYQAVCNGTTGHAEVVELSYDPSVISYREILHIFWRIHDPTTLNSQGNDSGTQYRSIILYHDATQKQSAEVSIQETESARLWSDPIVTELATAGSFYSAESYHQNYYRSNPSQPYCTMVIDPKVRKFRESYSELLNPASD